VAGAAAEGKSNRTSKLVVGVGVLVLGVAALVFIVLRASGGGSGVTRFGYGALALPDGGNGPEALVLGRKNEDAGSRFFLEVVSPDALRWDVETTPMRVDTALGLVSASADKERVYALLLEDKPGRGGVVSAYARRDGKLLWTTPLPQVPADAPRQKLRRLPMTEAVRVDGGQVFVLVEDVALGVMALDAATGRELWKHGLDPEVGRGFEVGPRSVAVLARGLALLDRATGAESARHEAFGAMCRAGDALLMRQRAGFVEVSLADGVPKSLVIPDTVPWVEACARRKGRWVVVGMKGGAFVMQALGDGKIDWEVELPGSGFSMLGGPTNGSAQGQGELEKRWPVVVYATLPSGEQVDRLVVVDVDKGEVVTRREGDGGAVKLGSSFVVGTRLGGVSVLDPDAQPLTTVSVSGVDIVEGLVADGRLWLVPGVSVVPPGQHRRLVLDLGTGNRVGSVGEPIPVDSRGLAASFPKAL
jgi:outer membrane protein assembly factor BamB